MSCYPDDQPIFFPSQSQNTSNHWFPASEKDVAGQSRLIRAQLLRRPRGAEAMMPSTLVTAIHKEVSANLLDPHPELTGGMIATSSPS